MEKIIFLNVGWMATYSGRGPITGGGKYVRTHGYGHEMLNFKPFTGKMYGTAVVPHYGALNLGKLGAAQGAEFVDGVLVVWVAQSRIVGWYKNARLYRRSQLPPKNSGRSYKGKPIRYLASAKASNCGLLNPDERHFWVPRARQRKKAMSRYMWYAEGVPNRAFRSKVLKYIAADGNLSVISKGKGPRKGGRHTHGADPQKKARVEQAAIELATRYFKKSQYIIESVEGDNVGWDLNAVHALNWLRLRLEVKGLPGTKISIEMTPNEYKMMRKHKQTYRILERTA